PRVVELDPLAAERDRARARVVGGGWRRGGGRRGRRWRLRERARRQGAGERRGREPDVSPPSLHGHRTSSTSMQSPSPPSWRRKSSIVATNGGCAGSSAALKPTWMVGGKSGIEGVPTDSYGEPSYSIH